MSKLLAAARTGVTRHRVTLAWSLLALLIAWIVLSPLLKLQQTALADGGSAYARMIDSSRFREVLLTTVYLAIGSVVIALVVGTGLAWTAYNLSHRWRWLAALPMFGLTLPPLAQVTGWAFLLSPKVGYLNTALRELPWWSHLEEGPVDVYTRPMIIVVTGALLIPYVYLFMHTGMLNIDASLIEAARMNGAGSATVFRRIVLPVTRPALVYSTIIVLLIGLGQFTAPLLLGNTLGVSVLTTEMYDAASVFPVDTGLAAAYGSPLVVFGIALLLLQRRFLRNPERFTVTSSRGHRTRAGGRHWGPVWITAYVVIGLGLPIMSNLIVALSPFWSRNIQWDRLGLSHFNRVFTDPVSLEAIRVTVIAILATIVVVVPLAYLAATLQTFQARRYRALKAIVDGLISVPLVLPGIIFGLGIVLTYTSGPIRIYGTLTAIVVAFVTITLPFVGRSIQTGFLANGRAFVEAARMCGAGPLQTHRRVVLPMVGGAVATACGLVVALLSHEISAAIMVRSPGTELMGTVLYRYWTRGTMSEAAVVALIMCGVAFGMVLLAQLAARKLSRSKGASRPAFPARLPGPGPTIPAQGERRASSHRRESAQGLPPARTGAGGGPGRGLLRIAAGRVAGAARPQRLR